MPIVGPRLPPRILSVVASTIVAWIVCADVVSAAPATPPPDARSAAAAQFTRAPLSVAGNRIVRKGLRFRFFGVNRNSMEWGAANWSGCGGDGHFEAADFDAIRSWRANVVRLPLSQAAWLGRRCGAAAYARSVDRIVERANERGMYVILDLHWTDALGRAPCDAGCLSGQQPMPDADSVRFWKQVARRYARDPGVVFNLFNEPHEVDWACWRDGGCDVPAMTLRRAPGSPFGLWTRWGLHYRAAGMQQLYDAVRSTGARNLVVVGGADWASDLAGVGAGFALEGANIVYDVHVYTQFHNTVADWDLRFGRVAALVPVTSTEFGSADCTADVTRRLLRYFEAPAGNRRARIGWTVWSWNSPGECTQPSIIRRWDGTPLRAQGRLIQRAMRAASP